MPRAVPEVVLRVAGCAAVAAGLWVCGIAGVWAQDGVLCGRLADTLGATGMFSEEELARELGKCEAEAALCISELEESEEGGWARRYAGLPRGIAVVELEGVRSAGQARRLCAGCAGLAVMGANGIQDGRGTVRECLSDPGGGGLVGDMLEWASERVASVGRAAWEVLGDPENCFSCVVLLFVVGSVHAVGEAGFSVLVGVAVVIGPLVFLIWLTVKLGRHLVGTTAAQGGAEGGGAWPEIIGGSVRFGIAALFLGVGLGGSDVVYQWMVERVVTPAVSVGMGVGSEVAAGVLSFGGSERSALGYASRRWEEMRDAAQARLPDAVAEAVGPGGPAEEMGIEVMKLASALHLVGSLGMARGVGYMVDAGQGSSKTETLVAVVSGGLMLLMFGVFMVFLAVRLVDPLLRLAVVLAVSPLLVMAWVFPATQVAAWTGLRSFLHGIAFFIVAGVLYGVALQLVVLAMVGPEGFGPGGLDRFLEDLTSVEDSIDADGHVDVVKPAVTLVMALVSLGLAGQVGQIASMFAGLQPQGSVSENVERSAQSFGMGAVGMMWHGAVAAGGIAGRGMGRVGRRLFGGVGG